MLRFVLVAAVMAVAVASDLTELLNEKIGHAVYHAAFDVLATKMAGDHHRHNNADKLLESTLDFLSNVRELEEEPEEKVRSHRAKRDLEGQGDEDDKVNRRTTRSVPRLPFDESSFMHSYVQRTGVGKLLVVLVRCQ